MGEHSHISAELDNVSVVFSIKLVAIKESYEYTISSAQPFNFKELLICYQFE
jgi:hypothetical protein